ncbi:hypothetical protein BLA29_004412 [Euroglyphus maynei]|uniref:Uncharacterized protein n=1 Tax=Euroglyphus maynei TaxID=6958 RepID=A0A1Y3AQ04_EURMA|nr:hypothetical protein BLA29_004412 [Euroglyphus maynei]
MKRSLFLVFVSLVSLTMATHRHKQIFTIKPDHYEVADDEKTMNPNDQKSQTPVTVVPTTPNSVKVDVINHESMNMQRLIDQMMRWMNKQPHRTDNDQQQLKITNLNVNRIYPPCESCQDGKPCDKKDHQCKRPRLQISGNFCEELYTILERLELVQRAMCENDSGHLLPCNLFQLVITYSKELTKKVCHLQNHDGSRRRQRVHRTGCKGKLIFTHPKRLAYDEQRLCQNDMEPFGIVCESAIDLYEQLAKMLLNKYRQYGSQSSHFPHIESAMQKVLKRVVDYCDPKCDRIRDHVLHKWKQQVSCVNNECEAHKSLVDTIEMQLAKTCPTLNSNAFIIY